MTLPPIVNVPVAQVIVTLTSAEPMVPVPFAIPHDYEGPEGWVLTLTL